MINVPDSYIIGQEYHDRMIDSIIKYYMHSSVVLNREMKFKVDKGDVTLFHDGIRLCILYKRKISKNLIEDLKNNQKGFNFLGGYLNDILPKVNMEINQYKYKSGHVLNRPISIFDIVRCDITQIDTEEVDKFEYELAYPAFPDLLLGDENDKYFVHEFIDSITSYFYNNLDDCIRKIITSLEDCYHEYRIPNKRGRKKLYFRDRLDIFLEKKNYVQWDEKYLQILKSNLNFIYDLRNHIVHKNLRIDYSNEWFDVALKGIGTLKYIYTANFIDGEIIEYLDGVVMMMQLIRGSLMSFDNDDYENIEDKKEEIQEAKSIKDLNDFVFGGLKIPEETKRKLL